MARQPEETKAAQSIPYLITQDCQKRKGRSIPVARDCQERWPKVSPHLIVRHSRERRGRGGPKHPCHCTRRPGEAICLTFYGHYLAYFARLQHLDRQNGVGVKYRVHRASSVGVLATEPSLRAMFRVVLVKDNFFFYKLCQNVAI